MSKETEPETTEGIDSSTAQQTVDAEHIFDPAALLREMTMGKPVAKKGEGRAEARPHQQPRQQQPDEEEEQPEEEAEEPAEEPEEQPEEQEQEEETTTEEVIKDPAGFLKAHTEMKQKGAVRDALLTEVRNLLGAKDSKEVRAKLEALREQAATVDIPATAPTPQRPLGNVRSDREMDSAIAYWEKQLAWCMENADGGVYEFVRDGKPAEEEVDEKWVKDQRDFALRVLTKHVPERRKFIELLKAETAKADPVYPFYAPTATEDMRKPLVDLITDLDEWVPEFRHYPRIAALLGDAAVGRLVRSGKYGVSYKNGKVQVLSLTGNGKSPATTAPAKKLPPLTHRTSTVPGKRLSAQDEAADKAGAMVRDGDSEGAFREMILHQINSAA